VFIEQYVPELFVNISVHMVDPKKLEGGGEFDEDISQLLMEALSIVHSMSEPELVPSIHAVIELSVPILT
jgi:hypothetical protein